MRAVVIISAEESEIVKHLERQYGGPPDDPYPDVQQWFKEIAADVAVPAMRQEVSHIPFKIELDHFENVASTPTACEHNWYLGRISLDYRPLNDDPWTFRIFFYCTRCADTKIATEEHDVGSERYNALISIKNSYFQGY